MVPLHCSRPRSLCPASPRQSPSPASCYLWSRWASRAGKFHKIDLVSAPSWSCRCKHPDSRSGIVNQPPGQKYGRRAWSPFPLGPRGGKNPTEGLYMSQMGRENERGWSQHSDMLQGRVTHGDPPGAFAVGFVEAREGLAANKAWVCHQVPSTVEHRPVGDNGERLVGVDTVALWDNRTALVQVHRDALEYFDQLPFKGL